MLSTIRKFLAMTGLAAAGALLGALLGELLFVGSAERVPPRSICLLFDVSGSMRQRIRPKGDPIGQTQLEALRQAATEFVQRQDLGRDALGLVAFASKSQVKAPLGKEALPLCSQIAGLVADGTTNLADGLDDALRVLDGAKGDRWILLFSDGKPEDLDPRRDAEALALTAAARVRAAGVRIVAIGTGLADGEFMQRVTGEKHNVILSDPQKLQEAFARGEQRIYSRQMLAGQLDETDLVASITRTGLWASLIAIGMGLMMVVGQNRWQRRAALRLRQAAVVVAGGLLTGALAGAAGQALFFTLAELAWIGAAGRVAAWVVLGCGAALGTSMFVPNLRRRGAAAAGIAAGVVAAAVFVFAVPEYGDMAGRLASAAVLGAFTAMALFVLEAVARRAWLVVHWSPRETSTMLLGDTPIVVGGGPQAHVRTSFQKGAAPVAATFRFADGQAMLERDGGRRAVRDGEFVEFGKVRVQVRVATADGKGDGKPTAAPAAAPAKAKEPTVRNAPPPRKPEPRVPEPKAAATKAAPPRLPEPWLRAGSGPER